MRRITLTLLLALAPLAARAQYTDRIPFDGEPGGTYCVLFSGAANVAVNLTETAQAGRYEVLATALDEGVLAAGTYTGRVYNRAASGLNPTTHASLWVASVSAFQWDGDSIVTADERLVLRATADTGSGTIGRALHNLRQYFGSSTTGVASAAGLANGPSGSAEVDRAAAQMIASWVIASRGTFYPNRNAVWVMERTATGIDVVDDKILTKRDTETRKLWVDVSGLLGRNEAIESIGVVSVTEDPTIVADSEGFTAGSLIYFEVDGGTANDECTVTVADVTTTEGQVFDIEVPLNVVD